MVPIRRNKSVKQKLFASFLLAIAIPLLLFSLTASVYFLSRENSKRREKLAGLSQSVSALLEDEFQRIDQFVFGLSVTAWIEKLMYSQNELFDYSRFDPTEIRNYNQQLFVSTILNPFLLSMDLVLNEKDIVFSGGTYLSTLNEYLETTFDLRESSYMELRSTISRNNHGTIVFPVKQFDSDEQRMLYIRSIPGRGDSVTRATVISMLNIEYIGDAIREVIQPGAMKIILGWHGNLLLGDDAIWATLGYQGIQEAPDDSGLRRLRAGGEAYTALASSSYGISILVLSRDRDYLGNIIFVVIVSLLGLIAALTSGYIFAKLFARRHYRPLDALLEWLQSPDRRPDDIEGMSEEYSSIYQAYRQTLDETETQVAAIREQQVSMIEYCWQVMLERTHEVDDNILEKLMEFDPVALYRLHFCAVVIDGDHRSLAISLSEVAEETSGALCNIVHYARFTVVVFHVSDDVVRDRIHRLLTDRAGLKNVGQARCGVGLSYQDIKKINKSYNEAMLVLHCGAENEPVRITFRRDFERLVSSFSYSIAQETRIGNALRNGDYDAAMEVISELMETNIAMNPGSPKAIQNLLIAVYLTGVRISSEVGLEIEQYVDPAELLNSNLIDEISLVVNAYLRSLCDVIRSESHGDEDQIAAIRSFIESNITNPNLSMRLVSDHIERSQAYTSRCFNRVFGMSFIEYVNRSRVDLASRLIKESRETLKEISREVGFSTEISFRRSFLRYKGVTAGKYRKLA